MPAYVIFCILVSTVGAQKTPPPLKPCTGKETNSGPCTFKVTYRDFQAERMTNTGEAPNIYEKYIPDFEAPNINGNPHAPVNGLLKNVLNKAHKPELSDQHSQMTSPDTFAAWFDECAGPAGPGLTCGSSAKSCAKTQQNGIPCGYSYRFDSVLKVNYNAITKKYSLKNNNQFLPLSDKNCPQSLVDGKCGWGNQPRWADPFENYGFTTEINLLFKYKGGETFQFSGDDDFWVFIGSRLAVDIGGLHPPICKSLQLPAASCQTCEGVVSYCDGGEDYKFDASYLKVGQTYRFDLFHAERHSTGSNFNFETTLDLKADTCKGFLQELKAGAYTSSNLGPGLLVTDESCPDEKFEFEETEGSSFCDIRKCRPGYEAVGNNYLRLTCDGDQLKSYGKNFKCSKITSSTSTIASDSTGVNTISTTKDATTKDATTPVRSTSARTTKASTKAPGNTSPGTASAEPSTSTKPRTAPTTVNKDITTLVTSASPKPTIRTGVNTIPTDSETENPSVNDVDSGALLTLSGATATLLAMTLSVI